MGRRGHRCGRCGCSHCVCGTDKDMMAPPRRPGGVWKSPFSKDATPSLAKEPEKKEVKTMAAKHLRIIEHGDDFVAVTQGAVVYIVPRDAWKQYQTEHGDLKKDPTVLLRYSDIAISYQQGTVLKSRFSHKYVADPLETLNGIVTKQKVAAALETPVDSPEREGIYTAVRKEIAKG